jgi:peptidoglycan/LPS O-acetylase OafA/YrhL
MYSFDSDPVAVCGSLAPDKTMHPAHQSTQTALPSTRVQEAWLGGLATAWLSPRAPLLHGIALCGLIAAKTTYLYSTGRVDGPSWFEAGAGLMPVVAVLSGCALVGRRAQARRGPHP